MSRRIPADRSGIDTHYDPEGKDMNKSMTQYGCHIDEPGLFDASFFNMSPREAMVVNPQMRLSLVTAYEPSSKQEWLSTGRLQPKPRGSVPTTGKQQTTAVRSIKVSIIRDKSLSCPERS